MGSIQLSALVIGHMLVSLLKQAMVRSPISLLLVITTLTTLPFSQAVPGPVVTTLNGAVRGSLLKSAKGSCIHSFRGVPYAQPPVAHLRFMDPQPAFAWRATLDATKLGPKCPQKISYAVDEVEDEDCLLLNIYKPVRPPQELPCHGLVSWRKREGRWWRRLLLWARISS
eukprot:TRINITY_DN3597_c0_g1_i1.p1 TRINITY_DN3597_c0_g1~~TRINITY_DN3597_c0_g1_i1.p1  ORF type:complete len:178 (-),score=42.99 TRINITY_DN3597_c0_g1_i1:232-741(-)